MLKGRNDTDFDANQEPEACSGTTESTAEEGLELHGGNIQQDTDDTCSEVSAVNPQSHSPSINSYPNQSSEEDSQDGKKGEVNCQLNVEEPLHKDKYNIHVVTGMITKWKNNPKRPAGLVISKAGTYDATVKRMLYKIIYFL